MSEGLCDRIQQEVAAQPILAKTVDKIILNWSLLATLCQKTSDALCHPAIKFLIEQNPSALVWKIGEGQSVLHSMAEDSEHCVLLPWIAEHFSWVLDHPVCRREPPHIALAKSYSNGGCSPLVVRRFYELYPKGLGQQRYMDEELPLHVCLTGWDECSADLVKWMAQQHPESMSHQDVAGLTPLHCACISLTEFSTENMTESCCFLAKECPQSVAMASNYFGCLPIHFVAKCSNRPAVQKVVIALLREFPASVDKVAENPRVYPTPRSIPFINAVDSVLQEERACHEEMASLSDSSVAWREVMSTSRSELYLAAGNVFQTWVSLRQQTLSSRLSSIPERLQQICHEFEGDDVESSDGDEDMDDSDEETEMDD